jgi:DNA-binding transcriptional MerR regulator
LKNTDEKLLSIGRAAKEAGISTQSLQYYIMIGVLEPTKISGSGRRLFDDKAVEKIKIIKRLNESGYPLRAIRDLFMKDSQGKKGAEL